MDLFDADILKLWLALNNNKVEYIIIGGFAANLHGYQRFTGDLDIWLNDTIENRKCLRKALTDYGLPDNAEYERLQFVAGWTAITLLNFFTLDIIVKIKGLENYSFTDCLSIASIADINGIKIPFLHINHLIDSKKASGRAKDLIDVSELEKIRNERK